MQLVISIVSHRTDQLHRRIYYVYFSCQVLIPHRISFLHTVSSHLGDEVLPGWSDKPSFHPSSPCYVSSSRTWARARSHVPIVLQHGPLHISVLLPNV